MNGRQRSARRFANLHKPARDWYRIVRNDAGGPTRVDVYDDIGGGGWWDDGGVTAAGFVAELAAIGGDLEIHINSPGGDVFDGIAIYNAIASRPGSVVTVVDGIAASIASVIAQAGNTRIISPGAMMMIHDGLSVCYGNAAEMRETADVLDQISGNLASIYETHGGSDAAAWRAAMQDETWYTAQQAVDAGLADQLAERPAPPAALAAANRWASELPGGAGRVLGIESMPVLDKAIGIHHTATVDTAWDGPAAVSAMPAEYADLHYCHAWQSADADASSHTPGDDDVDDKKSSFKFPHHKAEGGPANLAACRNGLARLSGASIPAADEAGVKAHLQAHLDDGAKGDDKNDHAGGMPAWIRGNAKEAD